MVPYRHLADLPLLPFEKRLISELGLSEEEYKAFAREVRTRSYERPAEYAGVPDVQNTWSLGLAIASLVIGLASTAASIFLAPKPRQPQQSQAQRPQFTSQDLGSVQGSDIFTPSYGFNSLQELAAYGNIVPIVFTKRQTNYDDRGEFQSGGVVISPTLVWSRVKSWGTYQISEIVAIAGQGPMARPELGGIFLGNNALDNIFNAYFDFYWNGGYEELGAGSRLRMYNLRYGDLSIDDGRGDEEQAFYAPIKGAANQPAFSGAFTPSNQVRFGVYSGIANGTPVRPDWEVISVLKDWEYDRKFRALAQQLKYVDLYLRLNHEWGGDYQRNGITENAGMPGTGVNYARRIGVIEHKNGSTGAVTYGPTITKTLEPYDTESWSNLTREVEVNKGDEIVILLGKGRQDVDPFAGVVGTDVPKVEDVRSTVDADVQRADALMALGATFMIGRSSWIVIDRPNKTYDPADSSDSTSGFRIRLKCIEAWSNNQRKIGLVAEEAITVARFMPYSDIDEAFYPILRFELGSFQNNRRCDVTEIGIKSQVWARLNGITNFNTLLSPFGVAQQNRGNNSLRSGKITQYVQRLSTFALDVRPTNSDAVRDYNRNEGWVNIGPYLFGVIGDSPVDIYSFIRITHPGRSQLEFRLRPFNSAVFTQQSGGTELIFVLDGARTGYQDWTFNTYMGTFTVGGRGHFVQPRDYFTHRQMAVVPELVDDVVYGRWVSDTSTIGVIPGSITCTEPGIGYNVGDAINFNTLSNIFSIALGIDPYFDNLPDGSRRTLTGWDYSRDASVRTITMSVELESYQRDIPGTARNKWWRIIATGVTGFTGPWNNGDVFTKHARNANGVQFAFSYTVTTGLVYEEYDEPRSATRLFQQYSGIAEVSHYGELISRSCDGNPEHEVVYVNECLAEDNVPEYQNCAVAGLKLRSSDNFQQLDQLRCYIQSGIEVERLIDGDTGSSNLLTDLLWYLATDTDTGAGSIVNSGLVDRTTLTETGRFLRANNLFYDDAIAESINIRGWLAEIAPSVLCFMTLKNGKLAIEPALPYDSNYKIAPDQALQIRGMFTDGNIIEDSLKLEWIDLEDRKLFQAAILYKWAGTNKMPEQQSVLVRYDEAGAADLPLENFELSHITGDIHALLAARYFLAVRKHVTHSVTFQTLPWGLSLAPGDYIRVATEVSPYSPTNNGIVKEDGTVISVTDLADGSYNVYYWDRTQTEVFSGVLEISGGVAQDLRDSVFSVIGSNVSSQVYQIEALDVNTDGIVTIKASNHPVNSSGQSLIARDVLDVDGNFEIVEGPTLE
jgi:hypothetical protein